MLHSRLATSLVALLSCLASSNGFAGTAACALSGRAFTYTYASGQKYTVSYETATRTWTGVAGEDAGRSETDLYDCSEVAPGVYFVRWSEKDGTFVSQVYNLSAGTVFSSGITDRKTWFLVGKLDPAQQ